MLIDCRRRRLRRLGGGPGECDEAIGHQALDLLAAESGGLLADVGEPIAEAGSFQPAVEGALVDAGIACRIGVGGRGDDDGDGGDLVVGEMEPRKWQGY